MLAAKGALWSTEVPHLSLPFPIFLVERDLICVCQNCLPVHLIIKLVYLSSLQAITRASTCSLSAMYTVKLVTVALTLAYFHRVFVALKKTKAINPRSASGIGIYIN